MDTTKGVLEIYIVDSDGRIIGYSSQKAKPEETFSETVEETCEENGVDYDVISASLLKTISSEELETIVAKSFQQKEAMITFQVKFARVTEKYLVELVISKEDAHEIFWASVNDEIGEAISEWSEERQCEFFANVQKILDKINNESPELLRYHTK